MGSEDEKAAQRISARGTSRGPPVKCAERGCCILLAISDSTDYTRTRLHYILPAWSWFYIRSSIFVWYSMCEVGSIFKFEIHLIFISYSDWYSYSGFIILIRFSGWNIEDRASVMSAQYYTKGGATIWWPSCPKRGVCTIYLPILHFLGFFPSKGEGK